MDEDTQVFPLVQKENELELKAAADFTQSTLINLTEHTLPSGVLNVLAKLTRQEIDKWLDDPVHTPSLQAIEGVIIKSVIERIEELKNPNAVTKEYLFANRHETVDAIEKIAMRIMSEHKLAGGHFTEGSFAIAVLRFELLKEAHGIFYPTLHDLMIENDIDRLQEIIVDKIIERVMKKVPMLLTTNSPEKLREAQ